MDTPLILKAELGDFLYIIIFVVLMLAGVFEKMLKAKRQQQAPPQPQPYDDFEDVDAPQTQTPPQTLEEMMRRMMQTVEAPEQVEEKVVIHSQAQSLEELPSAGRYFHHPEEVKKREQSGRVVYKPISVLPVEQKIESGDVPEFHFDIRQAIIASEILNRKY